MSKLLAPNGKTSNLTPEQYKIVRSPEFISWFGDWEKDPINSSKVVDENGEPLVVYHGTNNEFNIFNKSTRGAFGKGFYFTQNLKEAKGYGEKIIKVFINIKNPANTKQVQDVLLNIEDRLYLEDTLLSKKITERLLILKCDGVLFEYQNKDKFVVCFNPNQIKLADGTNTTFDENNDDIRFNDGGVAISKTPAPKKERIYGSNINKEKSSESNTSAKQIIFDEKTLKSIKNKVDKHNEENPDKLISIESAKAVVRRGMGAYSSSHRPTIKGGKPNSRVAWGLARLNAFIYKVKNGVSKSGKYTQDDDLIKELDSMYSLGGKVSILSYIWMWFGIKF